MPRFTRIGLALGQAIALATAFAAPALADWDSDGRDRRHSRLVIIALTADQRLIAFRPRAPHAAHTIGAVSNLSGDARIVGIDFRPATGDLYGVGDAGGIYTLDPESAEATFRAQLNASGMPLALAGSAFGVDFNPTVDRLRVVSDAADNLRINVDTGAATLDPDLNVGAPPVPALGVAGVAYTNNDADPNTATTLFDLDTEGGTDALFIQAPANAGSLNATGNLGLDALGEVGFDIFSRLRHGTTVDVVGFAALTSDRSRLYEIDLFTGKASLRGSFRRSDRVIGLAIAPDGEHDQNSDD